MESQFAWLEEYNIGVPQIDKEHQRLFRIINKLFSLKEEGKQRQWACQEGVKFFKSHAITHFADEEAYLESIHCEGREQHARLHQGFRENTLPALEKELEQDDYSPDAVEHFLGVCAGWLIGHTLTEDLALMGKNKQDSSKWDSLLIGENLAEIKRVIAQLVFDMFHLESQVISDVYSGEKFGQGVYYRLVYGGPDDGQKQEIFLVFEEKLLVNTVGKVMGIQTNKLDTMLVHATRYTARQFVERVMKYLPGMASYELKEENLLNYDQFQNVFKTAKLQVSLLFDTGEGYFSYCMIAPHLLEEGVVKPIEARNALSEVEEYLAEREVQKQQESTKRKVLIVDDSMTIREGMKHLLEADYEIALAESGVAAIRTITLNRPDLVLLDYEMPVCDGRQTLEMLRSEKAFEDIPVIFLTVRRDPESMIKVMPLKPAGYLLKNSKPADLKKEIDNFFEKKKG